MIRIAHASIDERKTIKNGKAGDQTCKELCIRSWYSKPWDYVIRFKDPDKREKVAVAMEKACKNDLIGYDQNQRNTLLSKSRAYGYDPGAVTVACETDCSALVSLACMYAGVKESDLVVYSNSATTHSLRSRLLKTGLVNVYNDNKYVAKDTYLMRGDILLKESSHVVVVLDNGSKASETSKTAVSAVKINQSVKGVQKWLNDEYGANLDVDGEYGPLTKKALVKAWQTEAGELNIDGEYGPKSKERAKSVKICRGSTGAIVTIWQAFLVCIGYKPNGIDGDFGSGCYNATKRYQIANGLEADGIVGVNTWTKAFK